MRDKLLQLKLTGSQLASILLLDGRSYRIQLLLAMCSFGLCSRADAASGITCRCTRVANDEDDYNVCCLSRPWSSGSANKPENADTIAYPHLTVCSYRHYSRHWPAYVVHNAGSTAI